MPTRIQSNLTPENQRKQEINLQTDNTNNSRSYSTNVRRSARVAQQKAHISSTTQEANMARKKKSRGKNNAQSTTTSSNNDQASQKKSPKRGNASDIRNFWNTETPKKDKKPQATNLGISEEEKKLKEDNKASINPLLIPMSKTIVIKQEWNGNIPEGVFPPEAVKQEYANQLKLERAYEEQSKIDPPHLSESDNEDMEESQRTEELQHQDRTETQTQTNSETERGKKSEEVNDSNDMEFPIGEYDQDYDEKEILSEGELNDLESETDENTIDSGNTTLWGTLEELDKVRELPSVRYQFSFLLEDITLTQLKEEHENKDKKLQ